MIEVGRLCVKTAGRDAGLRCVIIDILDNKFVLIDGGTRRRKCNIMHLEPLKDTIKIKKNASHEDVKKEFEKLGLKTRETKPKQKTERPIKQKKEKEKPAKDKKKAEEKEKPAKKQEEKSGIEEKLGLEEDKEKPKTPRKKKTGK